MFQSHQKDKIPLASSSHHKISPLPGETITKLGDFCQALYILSTRFLDFFMRWEGRNTDTYSFVCLKSQAKNTSAQLKNIWIKKETSFSVIDLS